MRWKRIDPELGETRLVTKFLWWPKSDKNGVKRWLERATLLYRYERIGYCEYSSRGWWFEGFVDNVDSLIKKDDSNADQD